jgi:hypothetical protein
VVAAGGTNEATEAAGAEDARRVSIVLVWIRFNGYAQRINPECRKWRHEFEDAIQRLYGPGIVTALTALTALAALTALTALTTLTALEATHSNADCTT